jgi:hypothetical protein
MVRIFEILQAPDGYSWISISHRDQGARDFAGRKAEGQYPHCVGLL